MYNLVVSPGAERDIEKLRRRITANDFRRIADTIENLSSNPHPKGVRKIFGLENLFRIRVGRYRIVFERLDKTQTVYIVEVVRRSESTYDF